MNEPNEPIEELIAVYALGGLTEEERAYVEAYIDQHPEAAQALAEAQAAAAALAYSAEPMPPSQTAETDLMARVEADAQRRFAPSDSTPRPRSSGLRQILYNLLAQPAAAGLAVAVAVLAIIWSVYLLSQVRQLEMAVANLSRDNDVMEETVSALTAENNELIQRVDRLEIANQALQDEVDQLADANLTLTQANADLQDQYVALQAEQDELEEENSALVAENESLQAELLAALDQSNPFSSSDLYSVTLEGTEVQPEAQAQLVVDPDNQVALLVAIDMPQLPQGSVYQVLLIRGTEHETAETFRVDTEGEGVLLVHSEQPIDSFDAVGVSIEPEGGSVQRTGDVVVIGSLPN